MMKTLFAALLSFTALVMHAQTVDLPDLSSVPADLTIPELSSGASAAGKRVAQTTQGWEGTEVHHLVYLPPSWKPGTKLPVIVEYAGNGGYKNKFGDVSEGTVEGSRLGYGFDGGQGFIWICMPYIETVDGVKRNAIKWWGDLEETKRYCIATVKDVCARFSGDEHQVILCGFSRGAIACNFLGLHDDDIAKLWCAFVCHSHYDGAKTAWPYPGADRASALNRLQRLNARPQFIIHERSVQETADYLKGTGLTGDWTFVPLPYRNHSDAWVLRDIPERKQLREWLSKVLKHP